MLSPFHINYERGKHVSTLDTQNGDGFWSSLWRCLSHDRRPSSELTMMQFSSFHSPSIITMLTRGSSDLECLKRQVNNFSPSTHTATAEFSQTLQHNSRKRWCQGRETKEAWKETCFFFAASPVPCFCVCLAEFSSLKLWVTVHSPFRFRSRSKRAPTDVKVKLPRCDVLPTFRFRLFALHFFRMELGMLERRSTLFEEGREIRC